jgi:hypothetical protein
MKMNRIIFKKQCRAQINLKLFLFVNILFVSILISLYQIWPISTFDKQKLQLQQNLAKNDLVGFLNNGDQIKYMAFECM